MTEEPGDDGEEQEEEPDTQILHAPTQRLSLETPTPEVKRFFSTEKIRKRLANDEHALALVVTATRLENITSLAIRQHYSWTLKKFKTEGYDNYSLGALMQECTEYGVLKEHEDVLNEMRSGEKQIVSLRNNLVHEYGYLEKLDEDTTLQQEIEEAIEKAIGFIESVEA